MSPIRTLLVANRGEIARRVFRTAAAMGITTVAVYSDPDADAPFVRDADVAVALGGTSSAESYLDQARILDAARRTGVDAIHPGYGFLAENATFAQACADAGVTFVGPPPDAIRSMALKVEAKEIAAAAGVPLLPGGGPDDAADVGFPLLVKASAGGGGKGMRLVEALEDLPAALAAARREAASSFGDPTVFLERCLPAPRHVEVQVFADMHGNVVHLFERECSIQRRHQKVVEEAPSPGVGDDTELRRRLTGAATALTRRIGYVGAGTVEFLVDGDDFWFLEMNTRLQVEHPVTEAVTGVDLVRLQLDVAAGRPLPFTQDDVSCTGHAIEVRLYAEDPSNGYMPSFGTLHSYEHDERTPGIRYEDGVATGSVVGTYYDPMLAKVIAAAPTRDEAAARLARALRGMAIHGVVTNRDFLAAILGDADFLAGKTFTDFLDTRPDVLGAEPADDTAPALAAALAAAHRRRLDTPQLGFAPSGWRNVPSQAQSVTLGGREIRYTIDGDRFTAAGVTGRILHVDRDTIDIEIERVRRRYSVKTYGGTHWVNAPDGQWQFSEEPRYPDHSHESDAGGPMAPVPGTVVVVEVSPGDHVVPGQTLVIMEAMKMEHRIEAAEGGVVAEILVKPGDNVDAHQVLVVLEVLDGIEVDGLEAEGGE